MCLGIERAHLLRSLNDTVQAVQFADGMPIFDPAIFKYTLDNPAPMLVKVDCLRFDVPEETRREISMEGVTEHGSRGITPRFNELECGKYRPEIGSVTRQQALPSEGKSCARS